MTLYNDIVYYSMSTFCAIPLKNDTVFRQKTSNQIHSRINFAKNIIMIPTVTKTNCSTAATAQVITTPAVTAQVIPRAVTAQVITTPGVTAQVIPRAVLSPPPQQLLLKLSPVQSPLKLSPPPQQLLLKLSSVQSPLKLSPPPQQLPLKLSLV